MVCLRKHLFRHKHRGAISEAESFIKKIDTSPSKRLESHYTV